MSRPPLSERETYGYWSTVQTRWNDNDVYGHVNNTVHYRWFDTVLNGWLIEHGLLNLDGSGPIGLVVESGCRYVASVSFPQTVDIGLAVEKIGTSSAVYRLGVFLEDRSEAVAEGQFVHVYVDPESRRPVPIPEAWRSELEALISA